MGLHFKEGVRQDTRHWVRQSDMAQKGSEGRPPKGVLGLFFTQTSPASYHSGMFSTPALLAICCQYRPHTFCHEYPAPP